MTFREKVFYMFFVVFVAIGGLAMFSWYSNYFERLAFNGEAVMSFGQFFLYFVGSGALVAVVILIALKARKNKKRRSPCSIYPPLPG
ncbi:hypothetical protein COV49_02200 [Candidatus Falkowbacteria bacterium CG11_big_fil_rev_8_21_14_0_20_39_10]|uniref:Uncharacterized protein n=1 Tax=Candidatus Falkowbacteria bacterium CG11_big_fil_rev_8_21_14_0_20_39_10 TaxID=1974570 RepID=A0A2M6K9D0_9BACT|nr:MAG: hypothetical protein COV49_02200 [Candidatus Falkowbacteria bacterium CG11_big_fil_rev_8_21_14_0_20_39_10]